MKKENDELINLFQSKLKHAEMPVRDEAWDKLTQGLNVVKQHKKMIFLRIASVAAVLFVLLASSAAFWFLSPKEEIEEAFTQLSYSSEMILNGDDVYQKLTPPAIVAKQQTTTPIKQSFFPSIDAEEETELITFSVTYSISSIESHGFDSSDDNQYFWLAGNGDATSKVKAPPAISDVSAVPKSSYSKWNLKIGAGIDRKSGV